MSGTGVGVVQFLGVFNFDKLGTGSRPCRCASRGTPRDFFDISWEDLKLLLRVPALP